MYTLVVEVLIVASHCPTTKGKKCLLPQPRAICVRVVIGHDQWNGI